MDASEETHQSGLRGVAQIFVDTEDILERPEERVVIERSIRNRTRLEERGEEDGTGAIAAEALSVVSGVRCRR
jgi:hypothetical protein